MDGITPTPITTTPANPQASEQTTFVASEPVKRNTGGKILSVIGITLLILLIGAALAYGGYYYGKHINVPAQPQVVPTIPQAIATPTSVPTPTPGGKKVSAGMLALVFSPYMITVLDGWTDTHASNAAAKSDKLQITKGNYALTVSQAAGGAGACTYPGEPTQPLGQVFSSFVDIQSSTSATVYRRGTSAADPTTLTVCEKKTGTYSFPTSFGYITYVVPTPIDTATLSQMDAMVASITKH